MALNPALIGNVVQQLGGLPDELEFKNSHFDWPEQRFPASFSSANLPADVGRSVRVTQLRLSHLSQEYLRAKFLTTRRYGMDSAVLLAGAKIYTLCMAKVFQNGALALLLL